MKKIIKFTLINFIMLISIISFIYLYAWITPSLKLNSAKSYYFYDNNNNLINGNDEWISLENIDKDIINATLAIEDNRFYKHQGFDYLRIIKSLYNNIKSRSFKEGASTITQQYAKNLFLDFDKTWKRKINEAWLTMRLETHYSKEKILEGYLNTINYGGVFGIENASKHYFNKSSSNLTLSEATLLAGIPNNPTKYNPIKNFKNAKERQKVILNVMVNKKYIDSNLSNKTFNEKIDIKNEINKKNDSINYFEDAVLKELKSLNIPNTIIKSGGLKIYTTFDRNAQQAINDSISKYKNDLEVASVIINPNNGAILGLIGGKDYNKSQFNRALSNNRSVGSTIKPFLYYSALENNFTASTKFKSEKTTFVFSNDKTYSPTNFASIYPNKDISLGTAIAYSDNIYAVKTHLFLGCDNLVETMKRFGITSKLNSIPSLALGSEPISLLEMTNAYGILANEGFKIKPHFINKIEDINGNVIYKYKYEKEQILNKNITFILNEMLANTTNPNFINYTYPTSYAIKNKLTKKYAIKTGTTEYDHLVFGYNKDVVVGLWTGYDNNQLLKQGDTINNKNLWADIIEAYLKNKEDNWYSIPNNVVGVLVDPLSGELANKNTKKPILQYYLKGTEPIDDINLENAIPTIKSN